MKHPLPRLSTALLQAVLAAATCFASLPGHAADGSDSVSENGQGTAARSVVGPILDGSQIQNPNTHPGNGTNRNYPGLNVTFDVPLRQPNGNVVPAGSNRPPIFNIAGSELDADGYGVTTADWVVGGSLVMPAGRRSVTITARVTDNANRTRSVSHVVGISPVENEQNLTPSP